MNPSPEELQACHRLARMLTPSTIRAYARMYLALRAGRGLRLSAADVACIMSDSEVVAALIEGICAEAEDEDYAT